MTDGYSFKYDEGVVTVSLEIRSTGTDEFEKELMLKFVKFCAGIFEKQEEMHFVQDEWTHKWKQVKPKKGKK